jgi:hypothetical protein
VSLEREISEFLFLLLEILQTVLLMKMRKLMLIGWERGGKRRRLQREEGVIEDAGSR